jgi:hypothetical protein
MAFEGSPLPVAGAIDPVTRSRATAAGWARPPVPKKASRSVANPPTGPRSGAA